MSALYYLLEANAYLLVFYAFYRIVLKNETFYTLNRFYLLITGLLSFLLPGIQLSGLNAGEVQYVMNSSPVLIQQPLTFWTPFHIGIIVYAMIATFFLIKLGLRLQHISCLIKQGRIKQQNGFKQVEIDEHALPFSFLNYLFINPDIPKIETIIRHEQVHIHQWHSADILFFEILQIINWFNPLISRIQADIKTLHEYIADEKTASQEGSASDYALFLINHSYGIDQTALSNQMFSRTLLKKRIEMLNRKRSGQKALLKYTLLLLLLPIMICSSALAFTKTYGLIDLMPATVYKVSQEPSKRLPPPPPAAKKVSKAGKIFPDTITWKKAATGKKLPPSPPEPPKPKVEKIKFPPFKVVPAEKVIKEQPPTVKVAPQPPRPPKPKVDQVRFPPAPPKPKATQVKYEDAPVIKQKAAKPPKPKVEQVKFPPLKVVPPEPPKPKVEQLRVEDPPVIKQTAPKQKVTQVKFPEVKVPAKKVIKEHPPTVKVASPPPPKPKVEQVKFSREDPPVIKEIEAIPRKSDKDLIKSPLPQAEPSSPTGKVRESKASEELLNNLLNKADQLFLDKDWKGLAQVSDEITKVNSEGSHKVFLKYLDQYNSRQRN